MILNTIWECTLLSRPIKTKLEILVIYFLFSLLLQLLIFSLLEKAGHRRQFPYKSLCLVGKC